MRRISKRKKRALDVLYRRSEPYQIPLGGTNPGDTWTPYTKHERKMMQDNKPKQPNVTKFSALPQRELLPFIKAEELTEIERFTILGARLITGGEFGAQWYFDIAFKDADGKVEKRCISLTTASDRDDVARRAQEGFIVGVRLDQSFTRAGNRRWIFADADTPRAETQQPEPVIPGLTDDDVPF